MRQLGPRSRLMRSAVSSCIFGMMWLIYTSAYDHLRQLREDFWMLVSDPQ
jgi:hypothetical protein